MSGVHHFNGEEGNFNWEGAAPRGYEKPGTKGADGKVLVGRKDGASNFVFRYFRVEPGGWTALEHHAHDHGVMILHGRALVRLGDQEFEAGPRDIVYISPDEVHQLRPVGDEPMGFLCVIPSKDSEIG